MGYQALSNLDQPSLNAFSTALHFTTSDQEVINVITSHTSPSVVPTLAVSMNRMSYSASSDAFAGSTAYEMPAVRGEDSAHNAHLSQPPLSPRLHSLPDNVLSPLGLLAEASLQNTDGKKGMGHLGNKSHRPSPLSMTEPRMSGSGRSGSGRVSSPSYRMTTSDVRSDEMGGEDGTAAETGRGVASQNYFMPGRFLAASYFSNLCKLMMHYLSFQCTSIGTKRR